MLQTYSFEAQTDLIMINSLLKIAPKPWILPISQIGSIQTNQTKKTQFNFIKKEKSSLLFLTNNYRFARNVAKINPVPKQQDHEKPSINDQQKAQIQPEQKAKKAPYYKHTQNYTFVDLDKDLSMYQEYLVIFNTHTKKPHQKLLKNEIKIIECMINTKRQDLLTKFLSINPRNRLANQKTIPSIQAYFTTKLKNNFVQIISSPSECQTLLEIITLLAEYNQLSLFTQFTNLINKQQNLDFSTSNKQNYLIKVLPTLPSRQCQFLFIYNYLIKQKQLPQYFLKSQWFGINTEDLKFHNLGEAFYDMRKFVRRYFSFYSKGLQDKQEVEELKTFERQHKKTTQSSTLERDVACFLKTLGYTSVRHQIQIDGFIVDLVVQPNKIFAPEGERLSTILEVMGSYHYTASGKLKTKDIRKLILLGSKYRQKKYNIKLIHHFDFNKSKGFRNKMQMIKNLIESPDKSINWQPQFKGYDSNWQLKQVYEEFK